MPIDSTPAAQALTTMQIPHRLFRHPGPVRSLEQAAEERQQSPAQVVRSILFRLGKDRYMMVLVAGPQQISWRSLRQQLGQSRLTMAKPEEVLRVTGYQIGAVTPFGMPQALPILVDKSVLAQEEVSIGSGERGTTIFIRTDDLMAALGKIDNAQDVEVVDVAES